MVELSPDADKIMNSLFTPGFKDPTVYIYSKICSREMIEYIKKVQDKLTEAKIETQIIINNDGYYNQKLANCYAIPEVMELWYGKVLRTIKNCIYIKDDHYTVDELFNIIINNNEDMNYENYRDQYIETVTF